MKRLSIKYKIDSLFCIFYLTELNALNMSALFILCAMMIMAMKVKTAVNTVDRQNLVKWIVSLFSGKVLMMNWCK